MKIKGFTTVLALVVLFGSPSAWGCGENGTQACGMGSCPMVDPQPERSCHAPSASAGHVSADCPLQSGLRLSCCEAPIDQEPAVVELPALWDSTPAPLVLLLDAVEVTPPHRPPDHLAEAVSSQRHRVGRYTLLASFLL